MIKRYVIIDSDWTTTTGMAILVVASAVLSVNSFKQLAQGELTKDASVHTVVLAVLVFWIAISATEPLLRIALGLIGLSAGFRAGAYYLHAHENTSHAIALGAVLLKAIGWTLMCVSAVQWFRYSAKLRKED
ncbi:MAG TPA: hypothetical protein VD837_07455 [Terriglobales bacterium]|nr:hypothetical protein [Terriglobales bacterium]